MPPASSRPAWSRCLPSRAPDGPRPRALVAPREPPRLGDEPLPPAACPQPGGLVSVGPRGLRAGPARRQAGPALGRLLGLPLVSRHGARVVRERRDRRADESPRRLDQGGPRGAPGRGPALHAGGAVHDWPRRLAYDRVPDPGRRALLRRHLLPAGGPPRHAGLPAAPAVDRRRVPPPARRGTPGGGPA